LKVSIEKILYESKNDTQKKIAYKLDDELDLIIKQKKIKPSDIFSSIKNDNDIIEFTNKIFEDFAISSNKAHITNNLKCSYVSCDNIYYSKIHSNRNFIETVIHEMAHVISTTHFAYNSQAFHDHFFISLMKELFSYYGIVNENEWAIAEFLSSNNKIKSFSDIDIKINKITKKEADKLIAINYTQTYQCNSNGYEFKDYENNKYNIITIDTKTNKAIHSQRNLMPYERDTNVFSKLSVNDLTNLYIISPNYSADDYGDPNYSKSGCAGVSILNAEISDNRNRLRTYKEFETCWSKNESNLFIKSKINEYKNKNKIYKKCSTLNEYSFYVREFRNICKVKNIPIKKS
jgi:hypothetical protein